jgi:hypothetical protein
MTPHRNAEVLEPTDESGDNRDGSASGNVTKKNASSVRRLAAAGPGHAPRVTRVSEIDRNGPEDNSDERVHARFPFRFACRLYFLTASTCQR